MKAHSPQDEVYGPLSIPAYCWPIIDTPEFQRMRHIPQLGTTSWIYPAATHSRFEHSLGVAHLAQQFMTHLKINQPELNIKEEWEHAVVIAGLCHDIGHGPWSHCFEAVAHLFDPTWDHEDNSVRILENMIDKYKLPLPRYIYEAACNFIRGEPYENFPVWTSQIIANHVTDIDLDKLDYLARDMNRTFLSARSDTERLIFNCRITQGELTYRKSETTTIERMFFNRIDMHRRVYQHRVNQALSLMITDMLKEAEPHLGISTSLNDPNEFIKFDCRLLYLIERGNCGKEAQKIANDIITRKFYKCIGEIKVHPTNKDGIQYSQRPSNSIEEDIAEYSNGAVKAESLRVCKLNFRYGLDNEHPLLKVGFYTNDSNNMIKLDKSEISCIIPAYFKETAMMAFVTDPSLIGVAKKAFEALKDAKGLV
ncbi:HD domain containing protein [Trichomonas vaginalis G3]|uniref:HD domain containing protein n=1 Tax=Trichomonas vaginalis (strain ATCC PRA-98 / G3) TaxID=412133 RepID=A2F5V7_TRIV3|nr:dGTPase protein [Trichomonas vaginalis G3]EAX99742.1 HD domain containing protein [Trichomonas vaginalis G3]KAI5501390.1 dGTPase protein [Trichomonas vaginalis G3]|eukprot:XP_001312672.1 HD domain containing protein [Trichomonas vaginalis G3]